MSYPCKLFNFRRKWMKYKNIIKLRLPETQLLAVVPEQLKFSIVKDHDEPTILLFQTLFCMWECFNMGTELPTKVMLGQTLVLIQMTFLNNVRKVGRLVLSRTSCRKMSFCKVGVIPGLYELKLNSRGNIQCRPYETHPAPLQRISEKVLSQIKRMECEADHIHLSAAKSRYAWSYTSTLNDVVLN
jgi:hypothetical protein